MHVQTGLFLEELTEEIEQDDFSTQTDYFLDRPPTPLFVPAKTGVDVATQIYENDVSIHQDPKNGIFSKQSLGIKFPAFQLNIFLTSMNALLDRNNLNSGICSSSTSTWKSNLSLKCWWVKRLNKLFWK